MPPAIKGTKKVTIRLYSEDVDTLQECFSDKGYNAALRELVAKFAKTLRLKGATTYADAARDADES